MSDWQELYEALNPSRPEGSKTAAEIASETGVSINTVRRALKAQSYNSLALKINGHLETVYWPKEKANGAVRSK